MNLKIPHTLLFTSIFFSGSLFSQEAEYPVATPTDQPDVVISPFHEERLLDVAGLKPGSLAEDPIANKIFRLPYSSPAKRFLEDQLTPGSDSIPPPPIEDADRAPDTESPRDRSPTTPSRVPVSNQMPTDLEGFINAFNENSSVNDPDALIPFYADVVENYFGEKNVTKDEIRSDRAAYIKRFPRREYILDGAPVLLSENGDVYEVMSRIRFAVSGNGQDHSGAVTENLRIRRKGRRFEVFGIEEAKAAAAPREVRQRDFEAIQSRPTPTTPPETDTVYGRFVVDQIHLFLDAFSASGEVNDPNAMIGFLDPKIRRYYSLNDPTPDQLITDRRNYIERWPSRKYWLSEQPIISLLSPGKWDVMTKTGYEVGSASRKSAGVTTSRIRLEQTPEGLKITSIHSED